MPKVEKRFFEGELGTTNGTLATVPASTTWVIRYITIANTNATEQTATISVAGVEIVPTKAVAANDALFIDMGCVLSAGELIEGFADATGVKVTVSGWEVTA